MRWNIPNILTLLRLLAAPAVAVMFLYFTRPWADWFALVLFITAALTDFLDGYLARLWKQESKFGAMMDPIADKAMVLIALLVITSLSSVNGGIMDPFILLPATVIFFREVFVSGLREFLGAAAGTLKVTKLAKYKTTAQMVAIAVLFAKGVFEHGYLNLIQGMDDETYTGVLDGTITDINGVNIYMMLMNTSWSIGVVLLWIAAVLTLVTGVDYYVKARPYLRDTGE